MKQTVSREQFLKYAQYDSELLKIEKQLLQCAERNKDNGNYCANNAWYGSFDKRVMSLIGDNAKDDRLRKGKAFDTVYEYLYALLPDCKHKSFFCWVNNDGAEAIVNPA